MRKDVKLGMAIGGGLISVLVGYLLFAPPANKKGAAFVNSNGGPPLGTIIDPTGPGELTGEEKPAATAKTGDGAAPGVVADTGGAPATGAKADVPAAGKAADKPKDWSVLDKGDKAKGGSGATVAKAPAGEGARASRAEKRDGPVAEAHGTPAPTRNETRLFYNPNDAWGGGVSTEAVFGGGSSKPSHTANATPADRATEAAPGEAAAEPGTHIVRAGETLSSIALQAYGSSSLYPHILRANPGLNANNLKLGAVIKLPKVDDVKSSATASTPTADALGGSPSVKEEARIDASKQYRVAQGDSLYKIAMKVYGKSSYIDKLYDRNKAAIGPNPTRLKLGMVLELPEKGATVAATPAGEPTTSALVGPAPVDGQQK